MRIPNCRCTAFLNISEISACYFLPTPTVTKGGNFQVQNLSHLTSIDSTLYSVNQSHPLGNIVGKPGGPFIHLNGSCLKTIGSVPTFLLHTYSERDGNHMQSRAFFWGKLRNNDNIASEVFMQPIPKYHYINLLLREQRLAFNRMEDW